MEDILIIIIQFLIEFSLEVLPWEPIDWPSRNRSIPEPSTLFLSCFLCFLGGSLLGGLSLIVFRRTLITHSVLRIVNVIVAPIVSASLSGAIARRRARINKYIIPRNHFWRAFWFTLGLVLIRFAYAQRT